VILYCFKYFTALGLIIWSSFIWQVYDKLFCQLLLSSAFFFQSDISVVLACDVTEHLLVFNCLVALPIVLLSIMSHV